MLHRHGYHTFVNKKASCLVNPRAGRETKLRLTVALHRKKIAVVGAGPAGLATAEAAATRGLNVEIFEAEEEIGGQFRYAMRVPGKEEFAGTLAYFERRLEVLGVPCTLVGEYRQLTSARSTTSSSPQVCCRGFPPSRVRTTQSS